MSIGVVVAGPPWLNSEQPAHGARLASRGAEPHPMLIQTGGDRPKEAFHPTAVDYCAKIRPSRLRMPLLTPCDVLALDSVAYFPGKD